MSEMEVDLPAGVPGAIRSLFEAYDNCIAVPNEFETEEQLEIYSRAANGHCMTCDGELGENTMATVMSIGIVLLFCGGSCYQDMQVMGWLQEQHQDILDKVKFRGGGDET